MWKASARLCYLDATQVLNPIGSFKDFKLCDATDHALGKLKGFIVDPAARRLRYFVVEAQQWLRKHEYLVPLCPATLECERNAVKFEFDDEPLGGWREFDDRLFSRFSDEDLLDALFRNSGPPTELAETQERCSSESHAPERKGSRRPNPCQAASQRMPQGCWHPLLLAFLPHEKCDSRGVAPDVPGASSLTHIPTYSMASKRLLESKDNSAIVLGGQDLVLTGHQREHLVENYRSRIALRAAGAAARIGRDGSTSRCPRSIRKSLYQHPTPVIVSAYWAAIGLLRSRGAALATLTHAASISSTGDTELDRLLPLDEPYNIPPSTAVLIESCKRRSGRVIAIAPRWCGHWKTLRALTGPSGPAAEQRRSASRKARPPRVSTCG